MTRPGDGAIARVALDRGALMTEIRQMRTGTKGILGGLGVLVAAAGATVLIGREPTTHATAPSPLGVPRGSQEMERLIDAPGPIAVETITAADWQVDREGLIDLDAPAAKEAGLKPGREAIHIYFHALRHPTRGLFLVDTGVEKQIAIDPARSALGGFAAKAMHAEQIHVKADLAGWLSREAAPPAGIFITHLHVDHVMGVRDLPAGTPIYAGSGETEGRSGLNLVTAPIVDRELAGKGPLYGWRFTADPDGRFASVIDIFGDGTVWAIWVPGHTPGSTAYIARTPTGPVLFTGDACHTRWGWDHQVAPGEYSRDRKLGAVSLQRLEELAARHPKMVVRLGHQD
jgi:glyoxylase-like metal-dependent hydrolase (beta-lactamase superfamily II)